MEFDGNILVEDIRQKLFKSGNLTGKRLVIFQTGSKESMYVRLKRKMGESLGVKVKVRVINDMEVLKKEMVEKGSDKRVDGVMVQLPIAGADNKRRDEILKLIPVEKDVDGLNPGGDIYLPAAVVAVEKILSGVQPLWEVEPQIVVMGSKGMVGKALVKRLGDLGYKVIGIDIRERKINHRERRSLCAVMMWGGKKARESLKKCEVVVSATGEAGLIKPDMVKDGVIAIDLGYPKPDFDEKIKKKARLFTPVPGGVGPVTVVSLFENLAKA